MAARDPLGNGPAVRDDGDMGKLAPALAVALLALVPAGGSAAPGDTTLVSGAGLRGPSADASAVAASLSGDGRLVAFVSDARNLSADSVSRVATVDVRDRLIGR